jgi:hypothetical protein
VIFTCRQPQGSTRAAGVVLVVLFTLVASHELALAAQLQQTRTIRTTPFANKNVSMRDNEGSAYVPRNQSLWLADDNGRAVYEVNALTGALKRVIGRTQFERARLVGGRLPMAGVDRTRDFESMAYDRAHDALYVFSCCGPPVLPTVFRLKRNPKGVFHVESYRRLPSTAKISAAAWNPAGGKLFVGHGRDIRSYDYGKNVLGKIFRVPGLIEILGMGFSPNGSNLFVTTANEQLRRVRWATKTLVGGWTFDLTPFGIGDSRAVELIGKRFFVIDGNDARPNGDPLRFAVHVLRVI